tara:strand:- start:563 stop:967 length:405 start_codon:yes stop_codon:yes gene_type:complete
MPRLKVKDMPRKQQMAVKASMAEKAAGKKSPAKNILTNLPATRLAKKVKSTGKAIAAGIKGFATGSTHSITRGVKKAKKAYDASKQGSALKMKTSPTLKKLSASCKAAAKRKFKVYPSAYANMWASKTQRQGKC